MKIILYHGSDHKIEKFQVQNKLNETTGYAKHGPGIYLTNLFDDARKYGRYIYKVEFSFQKNKLITKKEIPESILQKKFYFFKHLIKKNSAWRDVAMNWNENPEIGLYKAISSMIEVSDSYYEIYQYIWVDFFRDENKLFCDSIKNFYDATYIKGQEGVEHFIAYDGDKIKILNVVDKETLNESLIQKILLEAELEDNENEFDLNSFLEPNPNQLERYKQELERRKKVLEPFVKKLELGFREINKAFENKRWESEEEKLFLESFYNCEIKLDLKEYSNYIFIIKDDIIIAYQDLRSKWFGIDYESIWEVFENKFHWSYGEIQLFMKTMLNEHFKLRGYTPTRRIRRVGY